MDVYQTSSLEALFGLLSASSFICHDILIRVSEDGQIYSNVLELESDTGDDQKELWELDEAQWPYIQFDQHIVSCNTRLTKKRLGKEMDLGSYEFYFACSCEQIADVAASYYQKVLLYDDSIIEKKIKQIVKSLISGVNNALWPHLDKDILLKCSVFDEFNLKLYNSCRVQPRMVQLLEIAPVLASWYSLKGFPSDCGEEVLLLPIDKQLRQIMCLPNTSSLASLKLFFMNKHAITFANKLVAWSFARNQDGYYQDFEKIAKLNVNHLRRLKSPEEWGLVCAFADIDPELANIVLADPNFYKTYERVARADDTPIVFARDLGDMFLDQRTEIVGKKMSLVTLYDRQVEWHHRMQQISAEQAQAYREEHKVAMEAKVFPAPPIGLHIEEPNDESSQPKDVYELLYLKNELDVYDEGTAMRHCVRTYAQRIEDGLCFIYSLRDKRGMRIATCEITPSLEIAQARGYKNKMISKDDENRLHKLFAKIKTATN